MSNRSIHIGQEIYISKERPSQVYNEVWLYIDSRQYRPVNCVNVGKWMLYSNRTRKDSAGFTDLDHLWALVKQVVRKGHLMSAKCSTAFDKGDTSDIGVIVCYTPDYKNKADVKNAADAIREFIDYPYIMYYKTDSATGSGLYRYNGNKAISMYKHTRKNELFERDEDGETWKLVEL